MSDVPKPPGTPVPDDAVTAVSAAQDHADHRTILRGKYITSSVLGEGAFGRVYLAVDTHLRSNVAIKELLAERNGTDPARYEHYLDRFQREARAARISQHPNIVTVYDLDSDETGNYYLVMEYVDGTDLRTLLKNEGVLSVERAVALTIEIADALEAVHEQEIVHRDLKPANIMVTRRGHAKLADFGIAQVGHESMRTGIAVGHPGTPMYMSPEQSSSPQYLQGSSDLYSLGLILYEMLVGTPYVHIRLPLDEARPGTPPALVRIVNKLIATDPTARYQRAAEVARDLRHLTSAPTVPIPEDAAETVLPNTATVPRHPSLRPLPRGRTGIVVGSGILAAAMILALVLFASQRQTPVTPTATVTSPTTSAPTAVATASANTFTVADAQNGISFSYPQAWTASDDGIDASTPYVFTSVRPVGQLHVFVDRVDPGLTLDTYADTSLASLLSNGNKPGPKGKQTVQIAGQDARLIDAIGTLPTGDLAYYYQYITFHDNRVWNLAFLTALSETDAFQKQSDLVISSFVFCPASGCAQKNTAPKAPARTATAVTGTVAIATPAATPAATSMVIPATSPAATAAGTQSASLLTVADAKNLISFSYPQEWQPTPADPSADSPPLYAFTSRNPVGNFSLTRADVPPGTTLDAYTDDEVAVFLAMPHAKIGSIGRQKTTIAGQDARLIDVLIPQTNRPQFTYVYQYILLHDNRAWSLTFGTPEDQVDAFKARAAIVVSSFGFCPVRGCTQTNTAPTVPPMAARWTDPNNHVSLLYPSDWQVTKFAGSPTNLVELDGPDGVKFFVESDVQDGTPAQELQALIEGEAKDQSNTYVFGTVMTGVTVGGEQGSFVSYRFTVRGGPVSSLAGSNWVVNHSNQEYAFIASNIGVHQKEINAIIASVVFTK